MKKYMFLFLALGIQSAQAFEIVGKAFGPTLTETCVVAPTIDAEKNAEYQATVACSPYESVRQTSFVFATKCEMASKVGSFLYLIRGKTTATAQFECKAN